MNAINLYAFLIDVILLDITIYFTNNSNALMEFLRDFFVSIFGGLFAGVGAGVIVYMSTKKHEEEERIFKEEVSDKKLIIELVNSGQIDKVFLYLYSQQYLNKYLANKNIRFIEQHTFIHEDYKVIGDMIYYQDKIYFPKGYAFKGGQKNYIVAPLYSLLEEQYKIYEDSVLLSTLCESEKYRKLFKMIVKEFEKNVSGVKFSKNKYFKITLNGKSSIFREPFKPFDIRINDDKKNNFKIKKFNYFESDDKLLEILKDVYHNNNDNPKSYTNEDFDNFIKGEIYTEIKVVESNTNSDFTERLDCYNNYIEIVKIFNDSMNEFSNDKKTKSAKSKKEKSK